MSKTFIYCLAVIALYLVVVFPHTGTATPQQTETEKEDGKVGTGLTDNKDENGVSKGATGQQKYRSGHTS